MTFKVTEQWPEAGFLGHMRTAALIAALTGAGGSFGLMMHVGHRNHSALLLSLFAIWVLSPFVALVAANVRSKRWSVLTRATIYCMTVVLTLGSLAIYAKVALGPPMAKPASA